MRTSSRSAGELALVQPGCRESSGPAAIRGTGAATGSASSVAQKGASSGGPGSTSAAATATAAAVPAGPRSQYQLQSHRQGTTIDSRNTSVPGANTIYRHYSGAPKV